ncbi:MAG: TolC family protein [Bacteroidota bacterium]
MKADKIKNKLTLTLLLAISLSSCIPSLNTTKPTSAVMPGSYNGNADSTNTAKTSWKTFFTDPFLVTLIDSAIVNNPESNMALQEITIASNEAKMRNGYLLPHVNVNAYSAVDKSARYTSEGAGNATTDMEPGHPVPEPLGDFNLGFQASWEVDIWKKLHNSKKSAVEHYLASVEGRNFVVTNLVAEIANSYYELLALDNQLKIVRESIALQQRELEIVRVQKEAALATELAVKQFEAQLYNAQSMENIILQQISENENRINYLLGRYPQTIQRTTTLFTDMNPVVVNAGIPAQLLSNRADIRQAEHEMKAAGLDVKVAKAEFLPSLGVEGGWGYRAYKPAVLFTTPESMMYSILGGLTAPLLNRAVIKAEYANANARQIQSMYGYQNTVLNGYREVANQLSNMNNLQQSYLLKAKQVTTLNESVDIAHDLFQSAKADYLEVLTAQREALDAKLELNETMKLRFNAMVDMYKALGGGWF